MNGLEFREPWLLILLVTLPLLFYWMRRPQSTLIFSSLRLLGPPKSSWKTRLVWLPAFLIALSGALLVVAAAGPRIGDRNEEVKKEGIAIMMVMDNSGSMRALDLDDPDDQKEQTRLDVVKKVFQEFILGGEGLDGRKNDAVGLVRFAGFADTACPLTLDHSSLAGVAQSVDIVQDQNEDGTAIGDGLALAVSRIKRSKARSKIIILLTDGVNTAGTESPLSAAELAKSEGVKVYAIGAGTNGYAPIRLPGDSRLRSMQVQIDEESLKKIAEKTGGKYFRAKNYDSLKEVYGIIDGLEKTELKQVLYLQYTEYYRWALALALGCAMIAMGLDATYLRRGA